MKFTRSVAVAALPSYRASKRAKQTDLPRDHNERSELSEVTQVKAALRHIRISKSVSNYSCERRYQPMSLISLGNKLGVNLL